MKLDKRKYKRLTKKTYNTRKMLHAKCKEINDLPVYLNKKIKKNTNNKFYISLFLHIVFLLFSVFSINNIFFDNINKDKYKPVQKIVLAKSNNVKQEEIPNQIVIPSVNINASVKSSQIYKDKFNIRHFDTSYIDSSSKLDEKRGNSIIYGHSTPLVFRNLVYLINTDNIYVFGNNNIYKYEVTKLSTLKPDDIDLINTYGDTNLSLITCYGNDNEYRLLIKAKRIINYQIINEGVI